jgi:hypothetical protein
VHCLTGCAIGEILGLVLGTAFGWANGTTIAASIALAFFFGYSLTMLPLLRADLSLRQALPLAFASDTLSIATMEVLDTLTVLVIPGAMDAGLGRPALLGLAGWRVVHRLLGSVPGQPLADRPRQGARGHARLSLTVGRTAPTIWACSSSSDSQHSCFSWVCSPGRHRSASRCGAAARHAPGLRTT